MHKNARDSSPHLNTSRLGVRVSTLEWTCVGKADDSPPPFPFIPSTASPFLIRRATETVQRKENATKKIKWDDKTKGETSTNRRQLKQRAEEPADGAGRG